MRRAAQRGGSLGLDGRCGAVDDRQPAAVSSRRIRLYRTSVSSGRLGLSKIVTQGIDEKPVTD